MNSTARISEVAGVHGQMHLAPLASALDAVLAGLPRLAGELDGRAVHQQVPGEVQPLSSRDHSRLQRITPRIANSKQTHRDTRESRFESLFVPSTANQTPEQIARDRIDERLRAAGWKVQDKQAIDFAAGLGVAVREYQTDIGPADYVLFVDRRAVGVVEAKPDSWGVRLTSVEEQSEGYANAKLKWVSNTEPLPFLYETTGQLTRFTNARDPRPRSREVFTFHRPETLKAWAQANRSLRAGIEALPPLITEGLRDCQITAITNLEASLKADRPRALVQMATGSGKTFT